MAHNTESDQQAQNQQHHGLSKELAHSASTLANDSYMAGMSSDSELSSNARHHHRSYSSQSRAYHAHPAPRSSNNPSRMSHYSDSAASTYVSSRQQAQLANMAPGNPQQLQQQAGSHPSQSSMSSARLAHQASVLSSSSARGATSAGYLGLLESPAISPMLQQQRPSSGRQLPTRPFKQSMSIDQHALAGHSQCQSPHHQPHQIDPLNSPARPKSISHYEPGTANLSSAYSSAPQQHATHQSLSTLLAGLGNLPHHSSSSPVNHLDPQQRLELQRNFRHGMEMLEKRTAAINLNNDNELVSHSAGLLGSPLSSGGKSRVLSPVSPSILSSSEGSHHQAPAEQQYHQSDTQQQQMTSGLVDWLPPMGPSSHHHLSRPQTLGSTSQLKQAMSIDHYPVTSQEQQQQQLHQHHYPQQQLHFSSSQTQHFNEPVYRGSLGYPTIASGSCSSAGQPSVSSYDQLNHHHQQQQQQQQQQQIVYQSRSIEHYGHHHNEMVSHGQPSPQEQQAQHQQQPIYPNQAQARNIQHHDSSHQYLPSIYNSQSTRGSNYNTSGSQTTASHQSQLQHQASSSSSNSQSGSLSRVGVGSVMDATKSTAEQQKGKPPAHFQQQQSPQHGTSKVNYGYQQQPPRSHGTQRKGHTSVVSGLSGAGLTKYELGDSSSSRDLASHSDNLLASQDTSKRSSLRAVSPSATLASSDPAASYPVHPKYYQSSSYTKDISTGCGGSTRSESSTGPPNGPGNSSSLTKKSNSATQLSMSGTKKRLGFKKKQVTSFSVHRSEEVAPFDAKHLVKQGSSVSEGESSLSGDSSSRSWSNSNFKQQNSEEIASMSFIDGLGKGQMISRQGLASPYLGDIQLSLCDRRGNLEVEVIRARNLQAKANKILPLTYVKLYLVKNRKCLAKLKTTLCNKRTLDPMFQQQLTFHEDYHGSILQSIVWGNFGKMDKKNFMGIAQISIDDLDLSDTVISWYKLFLPSSLQTLPSKSLRHTLLSNSSESFTTNTNNS